MSAIRTVIQSMCAYWKTHAFSVKTTCWHAILSFRLDILKVCICMQKSLSCKNVTLYLYTNLGVGVSLQGGKKNKPLNKKNDIMWPALKLLTKDTHDARCTVFAMQTFWKVCLDDQCILFSSTIYSSHRNKTVFTCSLKGPLPLQASWNIKPTNRAMRVHT